MLLRLLSDTSFKAFLPPDEFRVWITETKGEDDAETYGNGSKSWLLSGKRSLVHFAERGFHPLVNLVK